MQDGPWEEVQGGLKQIAYSMAGNGGVLVGVTGSGDVYRATQNLTTSPNWTKLDGGLSEVQVYGLEIVGTGGNGKVYYQNNLAPNWMELTGVNLKHVSYDGNQMVGCATNGDIYLASANFASLMKRTMPIWKKIDGGLSQVVVSGDTLYGVTSDCQIYRGNASATPNWTKVEGALKQIAYDGVWLIGIAPNGDVYVTQPRRGAGFRKLVESNLDYVTCMFGDVYGIKNSKIYHMGLGS